MKADRLRQLIDGILAGLDEATCGGAAARRVHLSRFHYDRLVGAALRESPGRFRRRLLLERSAYHLADGARVDQVCFDAGYESPEAFARAFRRSYETSPSHFRDQHKREFRLPSPNGVHFHPPAALITLNQRRPTMQDPILDLVHHDFWLTERLIESARTLPATSLDDEVMLQPATADFQVPATLRSMLARLVWTKEMWCATIAGRELRDGTDTSLDGLAARHAAAGEEFVELVTGIAKRGEWGTAFVDAMCDPPESFTFGGMLEHFITWTAARRQLVMAALASRGAPGVEGADPIRWAETRRATNS